MNARNLRVTVSASAVALDEVGQEGVPSARTTRGMPRLSNDFGVRVACKVKARVRAWHPASCSLEAAVLGMSLVIGTAACSDEAAVRTEIEDVGRRAESEPAEAHETPLDADVRPGVGSDAGCSSPPTETEVPQLWPGPCVMRYFGSNEDGIGYTDRHEYTYSATGDRASDVWFDDLRDEVLQVETWEYAEPGLLSVHDRYVRDDDSPGLILVGSTRYEYRRRADGLVLEMLSDSSSGLTRKFVTVYEYAAGDSLVVRTLIGRATTMRNEWTLGTALAMTTYAYDDDRRLSDERILMRRHRDDAMEVDIREGGHDSSEHSQYTYRDGRLVRVSTERREPARPGTNTERGNFDSTVTYHYCPFDACERLESVKDFLTGTRSTNTTVRNFRDGHLLLEESYPAYSFDPVAPPRFVLPYTTQYERDSAGNVLTRIEFGNAYYDPSYTFYDYRCWDAGND